MISFLVGLGVGAAATLLVGFIWAALVVASRADDNSLTLTSAPEPVTDEVADLRHHLAICQQPAEQQRQRADYYYDLFCEGARANAQLRNGGQ